MKPLGRKHYKDNTGGKHHCRAEGKFQTWWEKLCEPNKTAEKQQSKKDIEKQKE
ncbi:MAG: hypothetical protein PF440_10350 [Thiomicrorhabdus sp.]|jgi:hypothetical protein|nr:hypothetical protein [Thiomicrorhabdus sp.]